MPQLLPVQPFDLIVFAATRPYGWRTRSETALVSSRLQAVTIRPTPERDPESAESPSSIGFNVARKAKRDCGAVGQ
jgi:hypothetical protein